MKATRPKKDKRIKYSLFSFLRFALFLALTGFVVTCSFLLFFSDKFSEESILIKDNTLSGRAVYAAFNIIFICVVLSVIDVVKRKISIEIPVRKILDATHRITHGDFSARIIPRRRKKMKNELDIIIDDFNIMAESISQTETLKTDFIANVSHEIKTPLSVIQNYSAMLQQENISDEKRIEYASGLSTASKNLSELISGILRLSKLENQQIFPETEKYDLGEQICEVMLKFENNWEEKKLDINVDLQEDVIIEADRELLEIVWSNLLSNAVKFTPDGGSVSVKMKEEGKSIYVSVADTGCGMTEETGRHIFEKFYQGDTSHATKGNGLGLALVKRVIDITNAEIQVKSEPGKGSEFTVVLPNITT